MSYIKNCNQCGERISMREMPGGQWVAFDVNTDQPHHHRKTKSRRKADEVKQMPSYKKNLSAQNNSSSDFSSYFLIFIVLVVLYALFSG